jgi:hypothetical protein
MAESTPSHLECQLRAVSRRLFVQSLLNALAWCWTGALLLAAGWFVAEPRLLAAPAVWLRWAVLGGLLAGGMILAVLVTVLRRATPLNAALSLDERFGLKERVATSIGLTPAERESPAGIALLADVEQRIASLDVGSRFPVALRWTAALVPACGVLLAVAALLYQPNKGQATTPTDDLSQPLAYSEQVEQKMKKLEKKTGDRKKGDASKPEKIQQFEDEMEKLTVRPRENRKQAQDLIKDATALEEKMMNHQRGLVDRNEALKEQLQQMDRLNKTEKQDGPANELQKALKDGDLDKAKDEIDKLAKKLEDKKLDEKDQEQLQRQMEDIKEKIQRLADQEKEQDRLEELARKGGADAEEARRQLDQLKKDSDKLKDNLKDLQEIADELAECQQCMKQGKSGQAGKCLRRAGEKMEKLAGNEELDDLDDQLDRLREAKKSLCKGCQGDGQCQGEGGQDSPPGNNPVPASGRRPESKEGQTGHINARSRAEVTKGELRIEGFEKGFNLKRPKKSSEIAGEIKQATQEAPEAINRMRIPKSVGDISKDYFDNLRRETDKEAEDAKPRP